jgi:putative transposase
MSSRELIEIKQHVPLRVLEQWIKHHDGPAGVLQRLLFIRLRYKGESVASAAESVSVTTQTGYNWQEWWNVDGLAGLIPKYAGGHPSRLSPKQKEGLLECLNEQDHWTTGEVQQLVRSRFGVSYSRDQIRRILKSFGMRPENPYQREYRWKVDAKPDLKKNSPDEPTHSDRDL